jgi:hypothetical protein
MLSSDGPLSGPQPESPRSSGSCGRARHRQKPAGGAGLADFGRVQVTNTTHPLQNERCRDLATCIENGYCKWRFCSTDLIWHLRKSCGVHEKERKPNLFRDMTDATLQSSSQNENLLAGLKFELQGNGDGSHSPTRSLLVLLGLFLYN